MLLIVPIRFSSNEAVIWSALLMQQIIPTGLLNMPLFSPSHLPAAQGKAALGLLQNCINSPILDGLRTERFQSCTSTRILL